MALRNQPYLPLYVQDFLTDEKLSECSAESTGVYIRLMCLMHKSENYGAILLKQKRKQNVKQNESKVLDFAFKLARQMPYDVDTIERSLSELLEENVISIEGDVLYQKRMMRDGKLSDTRASAGKKGGKKKSGQNFASQFASGFAIAKPQANTQANTESEIEYEDDNESVSEDEDIDSSPRVRAHEGRHKYGAYGWVKLSDDEYNRLLKELGEEDLTRCIAYVDESAQSTGNKNKWKDWNLVLRKCSRNRWGLNGYNSSDRGAPQRRTPMDDLRELHDQFSREEDDDG